MKRAKVLLFTNACTVSGAEMHFLSLARYLNKEKYNLVLVYLVERPDDARSLKEDFVNTGIKVIDLRARNKLDIFALINFAKVLRGYKLKVKMNYYEYYKEKVILVT